MYALTPSASIVDAFGTSTAIRTGRLRIRRNSTPIARMRRSATRRDASPAPRSFPPSFSGPDRNCADFSESARNDRSNGSLISVPISPRHARPVDVERTIGLRVAGARNRLHLEQRLHSDSLDHDVRSDQLDIRRGAGSVAICLDDPLRQTDTGCGDTDQRPDEEAPVRLVPTRISTSRFVRLPTKDWKEGGALSFRSSGNACSSAPETVADGGAR